MRTMLHSWLHLRTRRLDFKSKTMTLGSPTSGKLSGFRRKIYLYLHSGRLVRGCCATHAAGVRFGRPRIGRSAIPGENRGKVTVHRDLQRAAVFHD